MRLRQTPMLLGLLLVLVITPAASRPDLENQLAGHPSPYLALHGQDPVHWQLWGEEVLARARKENKLVFVSSGYFACHWCHVMQRESYRNPRTASYLNAYFIPVKVDRELQPALDKQLTDFVRRTRGNAGWPLNVFLTPEGYPLLGLTYLPPASFAELLDKLNDRWTQDRAGLAKLAREAATQPPPEAPSPPSVDALEFDRLLVRRALELGDELAGGFGQQSKFPMAPQLLALLEVQRRRPETRLAEFLLLTLEQMAGKGMRDHLGGGFFRYATDPDWRLPHFEKMLYDNAQLVNVYLQAADLFNEPRYRDVARDTLDFLLRELAAGDGTFMASLSAVDAQDVEGGYYLWAGDEIRQLLSEDEWAVARAYYGLDRPAAFEHGYHLIPVTRVEGLAAATHQSLGELEAALASIRKKLLTARSQRTLPVDTKVLSGWNGLMLEALVAGAKAFAARPEGARYRLAAARLREALEERFWDGKRLWRARNGDQELGDASLQDYAFVASGLCAWQEAFGTMPDRQLARRIAQQGWQRFHLDSMWRLGEDGLVPAGGAAALTDGAIPSPSAKLIAVTRGAGDPDNPVVSPRRIQQALDTASGIVAAAPFWYASYVALYHPWQPAEKPSCSAIPR